MKIIPLTEQDEISSIQQEVALLKDCNHPNIVKYYVSSACAVLYCAGLDRDVEGVGGWEALWA